MANKTWCCEAPPGTGEARTFTEVWQSQASAEKYAKVQFGNDLDFNIVHAGKYRTGRDRYEWIVDRTDDERFGERVETRDALQLITKNGREYFVVLRPVLSSRLTKSEIEEALFSSEGAGIDAPP